MNRTAISKQLPSCGWTKKLFLDTLTVAPVSTVLTKYFDVHVCKFICKYHSGRVFRGFVCANGQDNDDFHSKREDKERAPLSRFMWIYFA